MLLALIASLAGYAGLSDLAEARDDERDLLYRYKDDQGRTVMANQIPPEFVKYGYTVLNRHGHIVEEVPRAPTEEELQALRDAGLEAQQLEVQRQRQEAEDAQLLRAFSNAEDAERAMDRKLAALDVIIDITRGNMSRLNIELENDQIKAANIERSGGEVPDSIMENIDNLGRQIEEAEAFIKEKGEEKITVKESYTKNIERLKSLGR